MADTPFDSIESAQEYLRLLACEVDVARADIAEDIDEAVGGRADRRLDALRIVDYKLKQLAQHLGCSHRILNDLRKLRRLLASEPEVVSVIAPRPGSRPTRR